MRNYYNEKMFAFAFGITCILCKDMHYLFVRKAEHRIF